MHITMTCISTNNNPPLVSENQTTTTFTPSLVSGIRIIGKLFQNEFGNTESDIWSFKTPTLLNWLKVLKYYFPTTKLD